MPLSAERLQREIADLANLPTLPGVVKLVGSMVEDDSTTAQDIGKLISRDQVLSAKILRMVNSPFYGFPGRISSVSHAVVLLGFNVVKGLLLSTAVFDSLAKEAQSLWEHSLGVAVMSRRLAKDLSLGEPEEVMVAGLLHDLGKVIVSFLAPEDYDTAIIKAREEHCHISVAERAIFGYDHANAAEWVAQAWSLPDRLRETMAHHHHPGKARSHHATAAVVQLADVLARGMEYGDGGDPTIPPIDHDAFRELDFSFDQVGDVLRKVDDEFRRGIDIFRA